MKIVSAAVGAALANTEHLKPVVAPVVMGLRGAMLVIWGTIWKTFLFQIATGVLWMGAGMFSYILLGNRMLLDASGTLVLAFLIFLGIPVTVFILEILRVRKKLAKEAEAKAAAAVAAQVHVPQPVLEDFTEEPVVYALDTGYDSAETDDTVEGEVQDDNDWYTPARVRATHHLAN